MRERRGGFYKMFWEWFWDLYELTFNVQPCPSCKLLPSMDCGYLDKQYDYWSGVYEYECMAPDNEDGEMECDGCHHLICNKCKNREEKQNG